MTKDMEEKKIFLLIDGSAILHRAYHAMPDFMTHEGVPTGAVFGFFSMLLKLLQEIKPAYIAVAFDKSKPTIRQTMYAGYHANRPKAADGLRDQFSVVRKVLAETSIPVYEVDGYEGDDVVGTINEKVNQELKDTIVYIVTGDRDMMQLVDTDTKVLMPVKGISEVMLYDRVRVEEKFGVTPEQIIDYKALIGDPSDGYPGVAGIGPKTAAQLIQKYGTLEGVYKNLGQIEQENPKLGVKLAEGTEAAGLAKQLATIVNDTPFIFDISDCTIDHLSREKFEAAFGKYEFRSLIKRLDDVYAEKQNKSQMKLL